MRQRAQALAVAGEWIRAVGANDEIKALAGPGTRTVDAGGLTVVPGFNDAHNHMLKFGLALGYVDLHATRSIAELVSRLRQRQAEDEKRERRGAIIGRGYDQTELNEQRHPVAADLDQVAIDVPVVVIHRTGHFASANHRALSDCGITELTPDPSGGRIDRDGNLGVPTGHLEETARELLAPVLRPQRVDDIEHALERAVAVYSSEGVTSSQEAGIGVEHHLEGLAYQRLQENRRLPVRMNLMIRLELFHRRNSHLILPPGLRTGFGDHWLRLGPVKFFADGSLVGRTAAVREPYVGGTAGALGSYTMAPDELIETIGAAHRSGWRVAVHALGERAITTVLDGIEKAQADFPRADPRHRIEHCALVTREILQRIKDLGVIPVPQQRFIGKLGDALRRTLGTERLQRCYAVRSFLELGIPIPGSSDRPVVDGSPLAGIHDAVNQRTANGESYAPSEAIHAAEALHMYTVNSAYASGEEHLKGRLKPGFLADFVLLSEDLTAVDPQAIREIKVVATYVGGIAVFEK
jgi:predicted amidohydrolase YtcJ